jgi:hypothetical protein
MQEILLFEGTYNNFLESKSFLITLTQVHSFLSTVPYASLKSSTLRHFPLSLGELFSVEGRSSLSEPFEWDVRLHKAP